MHIAWNDELVCRNSSRVAATGKNNTGLSHFPLLVLHIEDPQCLVCAKKKVGGKVLRNLFHCLSPL